jgi:cytochrome c oxidase accessory protein FixG
MKNKIELSTADPDGNRKWIYPIVSKGPWYRRRLLVAILLMVWLFLAPWLKFDGKQLLLFDLVTRRIVFFGTTFLVNETFVFLAFVFFIFSSIFLLTALMGRVFCGWLCPITVFMEYVFRPIERWLEGSGGKQKEFLAKSFGDRWAQSLAKWFLFFLVSFVLGNTFVAFLMGSDSLVLMVREGPLDHWGPFVFMLISTGLIFFQYTWFREQICLFVCPYGRLQSVFLDRDSLIVAYDTKRGEPRGKPSQVTGDCVDCKMCVKVCPTGIDIRNGLQLECVHCTQCIDACDDVMSKLKRPMGLIRYQTMRELQNGLRIILRPRLFIYLAVFALSLVGLTTYSLSRNPYSITLHREAGRDLFTVDSEGWIVNPFKANLANRTDREVQLRLVSLEPTDLQIILPEGDHFSIPPQSKTVGFVLLKLSRAIFAAHSGVVDIKLKAVDAEQNAFVIKARVTGPLK